MQGMRPVGLAGPVSSCGISFVRRSSCHDPFITNHEAFVGSVWQVFRFPRPGNGFARTSGRRQLHTSMYQRANFHIRRVRFAGADCASDSDFV